MSTSAGRVWTVVKPHIPMIRFRKGGNQMVSAAAVPQGSNSVQTSAGKKSTLTQSITAAVLPKRFNRKPMTDLEMQAIQMGGLKAL